MALNADSAGLFATDQNGALQHDVDDVLEPDAAFDQLAAMLSGNAVQHAGGIEGAYHVAGPVVVTREQPLEQDGVDFVGIHKTAVLGDCADAVCVAVRHKARMAFLFYNGPLQHAYVRLDRLRINSRKQRVDFAPDLHVLNSPLAENIGENVAPRAVHAIDGELETGVNNFVEVGD